MQVQLPKQYLKLGSHTILEHTLMRLASVKAIAGIVLALAPDDPWWPELDFASDKPLHVVAGGAERCHSVLNCLNYLREHGHEQDWVLVHDAARPCVRVQDIEKLITTVGDNSSGGLLAIPVRDTMKRGRADQTVENTVDRNRLWHALTPQLFRLHDLTASLTAALAAGYLVTDEASAMEFSGGHPLLVEGTADNIKITRPEDLQLAGFYLQQQGA